MFKAQPESGFDSFLDQAQTVLAGAIKSGAAEKLLGSFFSSGQPQQQQGYAHQNAVSIIMKYLFVSVNLCILLLLSLFHKE